MCQISFIFDIVKFLAKGSFLKGCHPSYDYLGKAIDDIEKGFFAFNCQLKKLIGELFNRTTGSLFAPIEIQTNQKITFRFISDEPDVKSI